MGKLDIDRSSLRKKFSSEHHRHDALQLISEEAKPFNCVEDAPIDELLDRIGKAQIVLLGEATHGTAEFYQMRARISQELILKKGFTHIALEADWPDVEHVNRFIRHLPHGLIEKKAFKRFPSWMWKNEDFHSFVRWLRQHNSTAIHSQNQVNLYGLDLYNSIESIDVIQTFLQEKDPELAILAQALYKNFRSWGDHLNQYGFAVARGLAPACNDETTSVLLQLLKNYAEEKLSSENEFYPIFNNAVSIVNAEEYYRNLYVPGISTWNIRDHHMFETLESILELQEESSKVIVWAHNSHVGNAAATEMGKQGELSLGQLCKEKYGDKAYLIGFGTHKGTVTAATTWGGPIEVKEVKASHPDSVERLFHDCNIASFLLPLNQKKQKLREILMIELLTRAIGVIYLPETELRSHYFQTVLPYQFDEYVWFDHTHAVSPTSKKFLPSSADTYPLGI